MSVNKDQVIDKIDDTNTGEPGEKTFTQAEVDQMIKDRLARENKTHEKAIKDLQMKHGETVQEYEERIKTASMSAEEKYKYELEKYKTQVSEYTGKIKALEIDGVKKSVLSKSGLSEKFLNKVSGETPEEIENSVNELKEIMAEYLKGQAGGTPNNLNGGSAGGSKEDPILNSFDKEFNKF